MYPPREVPHAGVGADDGGLRRSGFGELLEKLPGHRGVPILWPVVSVEAVVERQEASKVPALGLDGGAGLAGDLAPEVQVSEGARLRLASASRAGTLCCRLCAGIRAVWGRFWVGIGPKSNT